MLFRHDPGQSRQDAGRRIQGVRRSAGLFRSFFLHPQGLHLVSQLPGLGLQGRPPVGRGFGKGLKEGSPPGLQNPHELGPGLAHHGEGLRPLLLQGGHLVGEALGLGQEPRPLPGLPARKGENLLGHGQEAEGRLTAGGAQSFGPFHLGGQGVAKAAGVGEKLPPDRERRQASQGQKDRKPVLGSHGAVLEVRVRISGGPLESMLHGVHRSPSESIGKVWRPGTTGQDTGDGRSGRGSLPLHSANPLDPLFDRGTTGYMDTPVPFVRGSLIVPLGMLRAVTTLNHHFGPPARPTHRSRWWW